MTPIAGTSDMAETHLLDVAGESHLFFASGFTLNLS